MKKFRCLLAVGFLSILLLACVDQTKTVVFIGDSLTDGDGVPDDSNFVSLLDSRSEHLNAGNQGRSGWSTTAYLKEEHRDDVLQNIPAGADVLVIQLGANDLRVHGHSEATIEQTVKNMEELINLFQQAVPGAEIVLMAPTGMEPGRLSPRMKEAGFGAQTNQYLGMLSRAYNDLAEKNHYSYLTLSGVLDEGMTLDGAHPTTAGHKKIAEHIWNHYLEDYLN
jgi:acyl-CoA thioesterase-1